ncbi:MAG TPA: M15 family metallopeptidase [Actinomycetota bacterium]|nr:M15 family metallopeptidase [Actinomycetota bacterium]
MTLNDVERRSDPRLDWEDTDPMMRVPPSPRRESVFVRRRAVLGAVLLVILVGGILTWRRGEIPVVDSGPQRGSPQWALEHYGDPDARGFKRRNIVAIDFLGRAMFVHEDARRHFLRLERLFEARAPEYAADVALGQVDDWSYLNRDVRGESVKSNHSLGLAVDINALANPLGSEGDMPDDVVQQWRTEGGAWGGDWSRSDPMHFETHLTPEEIKERYRRDGTPRDWYLEELIGD